MRRTCALVLVLALVFPLAAIAGGAAQDPDGAPAAEAVTVSTAGDLQTLALPGWIGSFLRVLLAHLGV